MAAPSLIPPHGGHLVNRIVDAARSRTLAEEAAPLPAVELSPKQACDLEMIGIGAFSPLVGFAGADDFESICKRLRLADGTLRPIPITLAVNDTIRATLAVGGRTVARSGRRTGPTDGSSRSTGSTSCLAPYAIQEARMPREKTIGQPYA